MRSLRCPARTTRCIASFVFVASVVATTVSAAPLSLTFDSASEVKQTGTRLDDTTPIHLEGRTRDVTGSAITNRFEFVAGSTSLGMTAAWLVAPLENRTVGVNIDLIDAANSVVASDTFLGVVGGTQATSQMFASGLIAGAKYTLVFTGTAAQSGRYGIDLVNGPALPPPVPTLPVVTPAVDRLQFDTHVGKKDLGFFITPGTSIGVDGRLADEPGSSIVDEFTFVLSGTTLSAGIEWIVANGPERTIGVNVDVFEASTNTLVISDTFEGLIDGQAFSQFATTGLSPGSYRMIFTGTAVGAGRYHIDLSTSATPPGFSPIVDAVPEPSALLLLMLGGSALALQRRRPSGATGAS